MALSHIGVISPTRIDMEWFNPKEKLPENGSIVAALQYHWKQCWPQSAEIIFGEAEIVHDEFGKVHARVNTCDFTGNGSFCYYFCTDNYPDSDHIAAWCYAKDFKKPNFLNHNTHWGELDE